jgi:hypothetical protein
MRIALIIHLGIHCLAIACPAQVFPSLSQRQEFLPFINPGAISYGQMAIDPDRPYSIILSHRRHLNALDEASPISFLAGLNLNVPFKGKAKLRIPFNGWVTRFDTHPLSFQAFSLSSGVLIDITRSTQLGVGFSLGGNSYRIGPLRPWNLGDPVLMLENNRDGSFHLGSGLFLSSTIPVKNINIFIIYGGFSIPFIPLCRNGDCYSYQSDPTKFLINRRSKCNLWAKYVQMGCILNPQNRLSFNMHGYLQHTVPGFMQVGFLARPEITIDDENARNKLRLGFGMNSSGVMSFETGFLWESTSCISVRIGFTFDAYLSNQYYGPATEINLAFAYGKP